MIIFGAGLSLIPPSEAVVVGLFSLKLTVVLAAGGVHAGDCFVMLASTGLSQRWLQ